MNIRNLTGLIVFLIVSICILLVITLTTVGQFLDYDIKIRGCESQLARDKNCILIAVPEDEV